MIKDRFELISYFTATFHRKKIILQNVITNTAISETSYLPGELGEFRKDHTNIR